MSLPTYQVVLLDPLAGLTTQNPIVGTLAETLRARVLSLGLDPAIDLKIISSDNFVAEVDYRSPLVGVYFGGNQQTDAVTGIVEELARNGVVVLPVVQTTDNYTTQVPLVLLPINAACIDPDDSKLERIAARLLEELRLLRARRLVFISYKRNESRVIAKQLYRALDERSFDVFLDTHSVQRGVEFQPMLWDSMGDADLVILLDTPGAFTSPWVEKEITQAHTLGLAVLQVVWPGHTRTVGSNLCEVEYLEAGEFQTAETGELGSLTSEKLSAIVVKAEVLRARALAARRTRIVGELCRTASALGMVVSVQPASFVTFQHPKQGLRAIFPVIGHPDSPQIHEAFDICHSSKGLEAKNGCLLYDPLGMLDKKNKHLVWLNEYLPMRTLRVTEVADWLTK